MPGESLNRRRNDIEQPAGSRSPHPQDLRSTSDRQAVLSLQRLAGNGAVVQALTAVGRARRPVVQREVVHWNLANGKKIDRKRGHEILGRLAKSDAKALKLLPKRTGRGILGSFEFGLGRSDQGRYCIVEGSGKNVNWSEDGTTKGVTPVAHSHPIENRQLDADYQLDELLKAGGDTDIQSARQIVLPSIDDVKVANQLKKTQATHHVYTPYRLQKRKGSWLVNRQVTKGPALTFRIENMESFIKKGGTDRYLRADMTAIAGSKDVLTVETWSMNFGKTDRALGFTKPTLELEPW